MHFNISTCYGLQIVLYLAQNRKIVSSTELSECLNISQRYVIQIAKKLRDGQIIDSYAGMSGGYKLRLKASAISVYDIAVMFEGDIVIPKCINQCDCEALQIVLYRAKEHLDDYFKSLSFDKLAEMSISGRATEILMIVESM